jgi:DNA-binding NtrC family response regulator
LDQKEKSMATILCVDNNQSILELYKEEFSEDGYEVLLADNWNEALLKYQTDPPQLVVMDIHLPGMTEIEFLSAILGKDRQAPVIINTAFPEYPKYFVTWKAEAFLFKSSDFSELKQKVREVLDKKPCAKVA